MAGLGRCVTTVCGENTCLTCGLISWIDLPIDLWKKEESNMGIITDEILFIFRSLDQFEQENTLPKTLDRRGTK